MKNKTDYRKYLLSVKEKILYGIIFLAGTTIIMYLFFGLLWPGPVLGIGFLPLFYRKMSAFLTDRRIKKIEEEFCLYMQLVVASLAGGTTFENVFREVADNVSVHKDSIIRKEFYAIDRSIRLHYDSREVFMDFAQRSGSGDIKNIAVALMCTSQSGGNTVSLLKNGVSSLRLKQDTEREIKRLISLPEMNHRIMTAMPFALVFLLKTLAPDYVSCLYVWPGQLIMCISLFLIIIAWVLGEKMGRVRL